MSLVDELLAGRTVEEVSAAEEKRKAESAARVKKILARKEELRVEKVVLQTKSRARALEAEKALHECQMAIWREKTAEKKAERASSTYAFRHL